MKSLEKSRVEAFIDSNVILRYLAGVEEASKLIKQIDIGFINPVVVSEVLYGYIRLASGLRPYELKTQYPKLNINLKPAFESLSDFILLPLSVELGEVEEFASKYKLLPNDALIALTCRHYGIEKIATFDSDFQRVDFLKILSL